MAGALCGRVDRGHPRCGRRVSRRVLRTSASGVLEVSDDTQMTLFTLEGQVRAAWDGVPLIAAIRQSYLDRYRTQKGRWNARDRSQASGLVRHAVLWQRQAPGHTCLSAPAEAVYRLDVLEPLLEGAGELAQAATLRRFSVRLR